MNDGKNEAFMKKKVYLLYTLCIIAGCAIGYFYTNLPPIDSEKPVVDVKVNVPEPTIIHDTIVKTKTKYKYVVRKNSCCGDCNHLQKDTLR